MFDYCGFGFSVQWAFMRLVIHANMLVLLESHIGAIFLIPKVWAVVIHHFFIYSNDSPESFDIRFLAISKYFSSSSIPMNFLFRFLQATPVVPEPINGSKIN